MVVIRAQGLMRVVREKLARLNRVFTETGSSDEDLVFHIRKSEWERPLCAHYPRARQKGRNG